MSEQHAEYRAGLALARQLVASENQIAELRAALTQMTDRFERCLIQHGTDAQCAAAAVQAARALVRSQ